MVFFASFFCSPRLEQFEANSKLNSWTGGCLIVSRRRNFPAQEKAVTCQSKMAASRAVALLRIGFELFDIQEKRKEEAEKTPANSPATLYSRETTH